jgi:hypothetical protein
VRRARVALGRSLVWWAATAVALAGAAGAVGAQAAGPGAAGAAAGGDRYVLTRFHGRAVPADLGTIPTRDGRETSCHLVVTAGALDLDLAAGRFEFGYETRETCTQHRMGGGGLYGLVARHGRELAFRVPRWVGTTPLDTVTFRGLVDADRVTLYPGPEALEFRRAPRGGAADPGADAGRGPIPGPAADAAVAARDQVVLSAAGGRRTVRLQWDAAAAGAAGLAIAPAAGGRPAGAGVLAFTTPAALRFRPDAFGPAVVLRAAPGEPMLALRFARAGAPGEEPEVCNAYGRAIAVSRAERGGPLRVEPVDAGGQVGCVRPMRLEAGPTPPAGPTAGPAGAAGRQPPSAPPP